jgi:DNA-directed RNA polymerase alpha subunit
MPIASMGFPVRITNTLEELAILTLSDLLEWTQYDLLQGGNLGVKTLDEIQVALRRYGFKALAKGDPPKKEVVVEPRETVKRKTGKNKK